MSKDLSLSCKQVIKDYFKQYPDESNYIDKKELRKYLKMMGPPSDRHMGREPRDFNGCPGCKKAGVRHYAKGYCSICYRRLKKKLDLDDSSTC